MQEVHTFCLEPSLSTGPLRAALDAAGSLMLKLGGGSMFPLIRDNDTVLVERCDKEAIRRGDILLFDVEGIRIVAHRLIAIIGNGKELAYITKGDAVLAFDQPIKRETIIGKITAVSRKNKLVEFDKAIWCRMLRFFQVRAPYAAMALSRAFLALQHAAGNIVRQK